MGTTGNKLVYINKTKSVKSRLFQTPPRGMNQLRQEGSQIKALDHPLILEVVQFDNFLDCSKYLDAKKFCGCKVKSIRLWWIDGCTAAG